jgi:DnaK suppressor protein
LNTNDEGEIQTLVNKNLGSVKERLLKKKQELELSLTQMSKEQFSDGQVQDPGDQAYASTMELLHTSLQDTGLEQYRILNRALEKIDDGTYGICIDCGNDISEKRLNSFPDASRCLVCQEEYEDSLL